MRLLMASICSANRTLTAMFFIACKHQHGSNKRVTHLPFRRGQTGLDGGGLKPDHICTGVSLLQQSDNCVDAAGVMVSDSSTHVGQHTWRHIAASAMDKPPLLLRVAEGKLPEELLQGDAVLRLHCQTLLLRPDTDSVQHPAYANPDLSAVSASVSAACRRCGCDGRNAS